MARFVKSSAVLRQLKSAGNMIGDPVQLAFLMVAQWEGFRDTAYLDQAGVSTIGYGRTGKDVVPGLKTTREAEEEWTKQRLQWLWKRIDYEAGRDLNVNQAAALLDFAYNMGLGALQRSTLWHLIQEGQWLPAADQFCRWDKITLPSGAKETAAGLLKRRAAERALFLADPPVTVA